MCDFVDGMDRCSDQKKKTDRESSKQQKTHRKRSQGPSGCRQKNKKGRMCQSDKHMGECPHSDKYSDLSSSDTSGRICRECAKEARLRAGRSDAPDSEFHITSMVNLKQEVYTQPRNCPICFTDISWLPKYGTCPRCCYKPVPIITERPYNEQQTAADILAEWGTTNTKGRFDNSIKNKCEIMRENRCKCSGGTVCAFCRIQNMCSDILGQTWKLSKNQNKECMKKISDFDVCKGDSDTEDVRPHLQRVISELKDLYDISNEERVDSNPNKDEECKRLVGGSDAVKAKKRSTCGIADVEVPNSKKIRRS